MITLLKMEKEVNKLKFKEQEKENKMTNLKLIKVLDVVEKATDDLREYVRVTFEVENQDKLIAKAKVSMSPDQWKTLKLNMGISYNTLLDDLHTENPRDISFDEKGMTKSKNPKPLVEYKKGTFKGYAFDYLEINVGVLIENNIVEKSEFKRDFGKLF